MSWERTVLGTRTQPRFGSSWSTVALVAIGLLFLLIGFVVGAVIVWALAAISFVIWRMR
jgi:hypothetical protein